MPKGWETRYCSSCGGTGESWNPMLGVFDGVCRSCRGTGEMKVKIAAPPPLPESEA